MSTMNERTFLKQFEQSKHRDRLVSETYKRFMRYCNENDITTNEISYDTLEELSEAFVDRGLGVGRSTQTQEAIDAFKEVQE